MLFFDFSKKQLPVSEIPYFQKVISFVKNWQSGNESIQIKTSGSTGEPKIIDIKRSQMVASAQLTGKTFRLNENTKAFCCINIYFIGGMMMLVRAIELKWQLTVIEPVSNPFLNIHSKVIYDFAAFVPLQLQSILENEETKKYFTEASGLKNVIIGGAAINDRTLVEIQEIDIPIWATYGMTETVSHIAIKRLNGVNRMDFFQQLENIELKIDDRNCLKIKGDCTDNQWIQTNDIVELNNDKFKLLGRANRVINSGGVKIYLDLVEKEIENDLNTYFQKAYRFFLFGIEDEYFGEKLGLAIEAENPKFAINPKDIFKNSILDKYKLPKTIHFLPQFIETESAKIDFLNTKKIILENEKLKD